LRKSITEELAARFQRLADTSLKSGAIDGSPLDPRAGCRDRLEVQQALFASVLEALPKLVRVQHLGQIDEGPRDGEHPNNRLSTLRRLSPSN
jgi:hypothetical protein